jgi:hypothetical protein
MKKISISILLITLFTAEPLLAAQYYFTNTTGTGNVSTLQNWSLDSAGTVPASSLPSRTDDVFFDGPSQTPTLGGPLDINSATFTNGAWNTISIQTAATSTIIDGYNDMGILGVKNFDTDALVPLGDDPAPEDADVTEFVARANVTDPVAIEQLKRFTYLMKTHAPTIWSRLVLVPTRSHQGYLHPFGGGVSSFPSTSTPFIEQGTVTESTAGASISYAANWPNRIATPFIYNNVRAAYEPWYVGIVANNNPAAPSARFVSSSKQIGWGTGSNWLYAFAAGDSVGNWHASAALQGAEGAQYRFDNYYAAYSRLPYLVGVQVQNGVQSVTSLINNQIVTATSTAVPSTNATTPLHFFPHLHTWGGVDASSGTLQYVVFILNGVSDVPEEAVNFFTILKMSMMSDMTHSLNNNFFQIHQSGQSNSDGESPRFNNWRINEQGANAHYSVSGLGGQPISVWLGSNANSPVRQSIYLSSLYNSGAATGTMEHHMSEYVPSVNNIRVFDWRHGESDTEDLARSLVYKQQLNNLFNFIKEDFGPDMKMGVMGIDYSLSYRTSSTQGNFVLSGFTGTSTVVNGTYVITPVTRIIDGVDGGLITNATTSYSWTKGDYTIVKNKYQWEIKNGSTVIARSSGDEVDHPQLVSNWIILSGTGSPAFGQSRTGNIEIVRKAQKDFALENPDSVFFYDSRGSARAQENPADPLYVSSDGVHISRWGRRNLSYKFRDALFANSYISQTSTLSASINGNLNIEGDGYNAGVIQGNLQLGKIDGTATSTNANYGTTTILTVYAEIDPATGLSVIGSTDDAENQVPRSGIISLGSYETLNVVGPLADDDITGAQAQSLISATSTIVISNAPSLDINGTYTLISDNIYMNGLRYARLDSGQLTFFRIEDAARNNIGNTVSLPDVGQSLLLDIVDDITISEPEESSRPRRSGGSVVTRVQNLEKMGQIEEAEQIKEQFPSVFNTNTQSSLPTSIEGLRTLLVQLQAQLAQLLSNTPASNNNPITRDLQLNDQGEDVRTLQQQLISKGYSISAGATGFFGTQTRDALIKFQQDNNITPAQGYFGPATRGAMNR